MCVDGTGTRCPKCRVEFSGGACPVCAPAAVSAVGKKKVPKTRVEFVVRSKVVALARAEGRRVGADFLLALDEFIRRKLRAACSVHNGGKKTLDVAVAGMVGLVSDRRANR